MDGLIYTGVIHKIKDEETKKGKKFQVLTFIRDTKDSASIEKIKNFTGEVFEPGKKVSIPVFISARSWNDRAFVDLIAA